jgi:hypothetical protein
LELPSYKVRKKGNKQTPIITINSMGIPTKNNVEYDLLIPGYGG